ncbi:MAG: zinc-dependent peptidase [Verrucomicrobiales bacterium]
MILAWDATRGSARDMRDGKNVAIHEFAHQLDFEDGTANGAPILDHGNQYAIWADVLGAEFEKLVVATEKGRKTVMDDYGATNPAEFSPWPARHFLRSACHGTQAPGTLQAAAYLLPRRSSALESPCKDQQEAVRGAGQGDFRCD